MDAITRRPLNVLHVVDSLAFGGTQAILKDLFESRRADRTIHLYGMRAVPHAMRVEHPNAVTSRWSTRFSLGPLRDLRRIVKEARISVLHCHLFRAQVFGFLLKLLFFPHIVLIVHEHGRVVGREGESAAESLLFSWFLRVAQPRVDRFICVSEHTRACLLRIVPRAAGKSVVVSNPVPVVPRPQELLDSQAARDALSIPPNAFVVGFASRLIRRKGWQDFLEAVARLAGELPVFYLMSGDGDDRQSAEARVRSLGLGSRGRMLGHIEWMSRFYACLDCFVMPSHWEPHGLAHLEAQGFGVPVIVARVPGMAATVDDRNALLFQPGDIDALADCIRKLAEAPALRDRLRRAGRANAARYTMEAFAANLDDVYAGLAPSQTAST